MTLTKAVRSVAIVGTLLTASAVAQTRFCIGGDLDRLSQAERATCSAKMQAVKAAASALHAPADWHFVVVCGEQGWRDYAAYSSGVAEALQGASADTNLEQHETFLRDARLNLGNVRSLQMVVAHEVAGILLRSKDEVAINHQVAQWMSDNTQAGL